ncbi:MAG TPA: VOC family protein [Candidatus Dormibacteraeota bacterium]|nr:VOC family protein [Candidatus Dormibacteraeota bacterium]
MNDDEPLTAHQFEASGGVEAWRVVASEAAAWFGTASLSEGARLVRRIAELADDADSLPDVDLRDRGVRVRVGARGSTGLTRADAEKARAISDAARDLGLVGDPAALQMLRLTIEALDRPAVMPFWHAVLGYAQLGDSLVDPMRRDPTIRFLDSDQQRPLRNRIHVDVVRPQSVTKQARKAVSAAGGRETYSGEYHATVADAEGNEADLIPIGGSGAGTAAEAQKAVDMLGAGPDTADWRVLFGGMTFYPIASPMRAAELAATVADLAAEARFPLLVDVRPEGVTIDTGKDRWEDGRFGDLARRVQTAARELGLAAEPARLRFVQFGIDAVDIAAVRDFWRVALGYEYDPRPSVTDIYDPRRLNPPVFFQQMSAADHSRRQQRDRVRLDLLVPADRARFRVDAALATGGRILSGGSGPASWRLADPEGNVLELAC